MTKSTQVDWRDFHKNLRCAAMFACKDDFRVAFNSILLKSASGKVSLAGTQGHSFYIGTQQCEGDDFEVLIPLERARKFLALSPPRKGDERARVALGSRCTMLADGTLFAFKPPSAQLPKYETVIPKTEKAACPLVGLNPLLLKPICEAFRILGQGQMKTEHGKDALGAFKFSSVGIPAVSVTVVLMPMRI